MLKHQGKKLYIYLWIIRFRIMLFCPTINNLTTHKDDNYQIYEHVKEMSTTCHVIYNMTIPLMLAKLFNGMIKMKSFKKLETIQKYTHKVNQLKE